MSLLWQLRMFMKSYRVVGWPACMTVGFFFFCSPRVQKVSTLSSPRPERIVRLQTADTTFYTVEFAGEHERKKFIGGLDRLLQQYSPRLETDTIGASLHIRVLASRSAEQPPQHPAPADNFEKVEAIAVEDVHNANLTPAAAQEPAILRGGTLRLYSHRSFIDEHLLPLVQTDPFARDSLLAESDSSVHHATGLLSSELLSPKRLRITLSDSIINGSSRQLISAFDIVDAWNAFCRTAPAQANGIFRATVGIEGILRGTEALLRGIQALDQRTITVTFSNEDKANEQRLRTPQLLPAGLKMGRYFIAASGGSTLKLAANPSYRFGKAFLDTIMLTLGGETDPLLSFSLGKYDVTTIYAARDVEYVRAKLSTKATVHFLGRDHYFLVIGNVSDEMRSFVRRSVRPSEILARSVKAAGSLLVTLVDTGRVGESVGGDAFYYQSPAGAKPITVIFRKGDPVSAAIAEHLVADFSRSGVLCQLKPLELTAFEQAIVARSFDIAIGWLTSPKPDDRAEQFRIADQWFNGIADENIRLRENRQIPLFAITTYLLCKNGISLYRGNVAGLCRVVTQQ